VLASRELGVGYDRAGLLAEVVHQTSGTFGRCVGVAVAMDHEERRSGAVVHQWRAGGSVVAIETSVVPAQADRRADRGVSPFEPGLKGWVVGRQGGHRREVRARRAT
jgi:hypothetical protein